MAFIVDSTKTKIMGVPDPTHGVHDARGSSFGADVLKIAGGTVLAQLVIMVASPIVARLYGPESFGLAALFASITGIIGVAACMRYEYSIMLPSSDEAAANLLGLSLLISALTGVLTTSAVWFFGEPFSQLIKAPNLAHYLWFVPPSIFFGGAFLALNYWNSRAKRFFRLSIARVTSSATTTGAQLGAGLSGHATGGSLIGAIVAGSAASTLILAAQIWRDDGRMIRGCLSWRSMISGLKRYRKFPLLDSWSAILNAVSWQLPIFLLSAFFSQTVVGYYALGLDVLQLPMSLIGSAIGQVFFQRAAEAKFQGSLPEVVESTFVRLGMVEVFPILLLSLAGRDLFVVIFGPTWAEAGVYVQILALWTFITFVTSPICTLFSVLERQGTFLAFNATLFAARATALTLGGMSGNARFTLALFTAISVTAWGCLCIWILKKMDIPLRRIVRSYARYVAYCVPLFALAAGRWTLALSPDETVLGCILAAVFYYLAAVAQDEALRSPLFDLLKRMGIAR